MFKDEEYEVVSNTEGSDGFGVKILVRRPKEVRQRIEELPNKLPEGQLGLTPKELARSMFWKTGDQIYKQLQVQAAELDPKTYERASSTKAKFTLAFHDADLVPIYMERIPNDYYGDDDPWGMGSPWFIVTTKLGHIKVGWRKRVIVLDWERTTIKSKAEEIFHDNTTMDGKMIHCWGYEKLTEYLTKLKEQQ